MGLRTFEVETNGGSRERIDAPSYREAVVEMGRRGWRPGLLKADGWVWEVLADGSAWVRVAPQVSADHVGMLLDTQGNRSIFDDVDA